MDLLREHGLLKLFLPQSLGGLELDPVTTAELVEAVSLSNTAAGWSMMVANVSAWWCSMTPEEGVDEIYLANPDAIIAGAFHPPMRAVREQEGYRISGRSPLASNVNCANWIFVTALVMDGSEIKRQEGVPEVIGVYLKRDDCQIIDTWHTSGMRSTDSNDIQVDNVLVPHHRLHPLLPGFAPNRYYQGPLYQFPAIGASIACLIAPVALATARNAIEVFKELAGKKVPFGSMVTTRDRGTVQRKLGMAEANVQASRAYLYQSLATTWKKTLEGQPSSMPEKSNLLLAATHTNQTCCQAVDLIYSAAGTSGIYHASRIAYHFSNAQVIRQHGFANESRYETVAQVHMGLPPDLPVLAF